MHTDSSTSEVSLSVGNVRHDDVSPTSAVKDEFGRRAEGSFISSGTRENLGLADTMSEIAHFEERDSLHRAVEYGSLKEVKFLLDYDADENYEDERKGTALHVAVKRGSLKIVKYLVENGAHVNYEHKREGPLLYVAAKHSTDVLEYLFEHAEEDLKKLAALYLAIQSGSLEKVNCVFEETGHINFSTTNGKLVLLHAVKRGSLEAVECLVKHGADVKYEHEWKGTALHAAVKRRSLEIVKCLVEHGADVNCAHDIKGTVLNAAAEYGSLEILKYLLEHGADVNFEVNGRGSVLSLAVDRGRLEIVKCLLEHGADGNYEHEREGPLLYVAAKHSTDVLKYLFEHADEDLKRVAALYLAIQSGSLEKVNRIFQEEGHLKFSTSNGKLVLLYAVEHGSLEVVKCLVKHGADVKYEHEWKGTALHAAVKRRSLEIVKCLVEHGADVNCAHDIKGTVLNAAAEYGSLEILKYLLEHGADVNYEVNGRGSVLSLAVDRGRLEIVKCLLEHGADGNYEHEREGPLLYVAAKHSTDVLKYLFEHADEDLKKLAALYLAIQSGSLEKVNRIFQEEGHLKFSTSNGKLVLLYAVEHGSLEVVKCLVKHGADVKYEHEWKGTALHAAVKRRSLEIVKCLVEHGADVNCAHDIKGTVLNAAAEYGSLEIVKYLLEHGADVNYEVNGRGSVLSLAVDRGRLEIVKCLLEHGADGNYEHEREGPLLYVAAKHSRVVLECLFEHVDKDLKRVAALYLAILSRSLENIKRIFKEKGSPNFSTSNEKVALCYAAERGSLEIVKYLVEHGADVNHENKWKGTALYVAVERGFLEIVKYLVEHGADVMYEHKSNGTALHIAARRRFLKIVQYLVEHGADVNYEHEWEGTALYVAASRGSFEIVKYLVEHGADVTYENRRKETALHVAVRHGCLEPVKSTGQHRADVKYKDERKGGVLPDAAERGYSAIANYLLENGALTKYEQKHKAQEEHWPSTGDLLMTHDEYYNLELPEILKTALPLRTTDQLELPSRKLQSDFEVLSEDEIEMDDNLKLISDFESENKANTNAALESCNRKEIYDNSITIDENGGVFKVPKASAFLIFPPNAVLEQVTLTYDRVMYKDCKVKPEDGEAFVSRILKLEPEGITFRKPVTVLLTHSAYEDQDFLDFYDLLVKSMNPTHCQELTTKRISNIEEVPEELCKLEDLDNCLPFAKTTITETCTIVAATRVKFDQIFLTKDQRFVFSQKYGKHIKLEVIFPKGVVDQKLCLTVQLFPADDVLNLDICLDKNLVCVPVIKVSGQKKPFLKPVQVQLSYTHEDVVNIHQDFLPVGEKVQFTTEYGLLLQSQEKSETDSKWMTLNDQNEVFLERRKEDQLEFFFSVEHFSMLSAVVKIRKKEKLPKKLETSNVHQSSFDAFVLAVHERDRTTLHAIVAPRTAKPEVEKRWGFETDHFGKVKAAEKIFFCVPQSDNSDNDHVSISDYTLRFDEEEWKEMPNEVGDDLSGKFMRFLQTNSCNGHNHYAQEDCRAKVKINVIPTRPAPVLAAAGNQPIPNEEVHQIVVASFDDEVKETEIPYLVQSLNNDAEKVAMLLGITAREIEAYRLERRPMEQTYINIFTSWRNTTLQNGHIPTWNDIKVALEDESVLRFDIIRSLLNEEELVSDRILLWLAHRIAPEYRRYGGALNMPNYVIDICTRSHDGVEERCTAMLQRWRQRTRTPTLTDLIHALEDEVIMRLDLAQEMREMFHIV